MKEFIYTHFLTTFADAKLKLDDKLLPKADETTVTNGLLNGVYTAAGIVAVVVIIVAGFFYVTSQGSSENIRRAKNAILYASIGLVVVIMAFSITWFVTNRLK